MTVFVSYSTRDGDTVKSLTQDLQDADEQVWLDQRLAGGDTWWRAILEQIRGCDVFAFALSQNSIESKPCQAELQYAQALGLPILPVQVGPVDSMQLNPLATVQTVDYRSPTPGTAMRLIAALHRARAQRQPLPSPLPDEPEVPFEYLIRLYTSIGGPDYLSPREQAALVAELQVGLREDGQHDAARKDIVMLLTKLHDREDANHRTRTDVEAILASIGAVPPIATAIAAVESPIVDAAKAASETVAPTEAAESSVAATQLRPSDQSSLDIDSREVPQKSPVEPKPPMSRRAVTTLPPASPGRRVGAALIDAIPILVIYGIAYGVYVGTAVHGCRQFPPDPDFICGWWWTASAEYEGYFYGIQPQALWIASLLAVAYSIWNWGYWQGRTGSSIGKSLLKFKVVNERTGQPIGFGAKRIIKVLAITLVAAVLLAYGVWGLSFKTLQKSYPYGVQIRA